MTNHIKLSSKIEKIKFKNKFIYYSSSLTNKGLFLKSILPVDYGKKFSKKIQVKYFLGDSL